MVNAAAGESADAPSAEPQPVSYFEGLHFDHLCNAKVNRYVTTLKKKETWFVDDNNNFAVSETFVAPPPRSPGDDEGDRAGDGQDGGTTKPPITVLMPGLDTGAYRGAHCTAEMLHKRVLSEVTSYTQTIDEEPEFFREEVRRACV